MANAIEELNKAERALAKASSIVEMKQLRDQAAAIAILADAQGFERAAQQAKIFQLKAERKAGAWLGEFGRKPENGRPKEVSHAATLNDLGISRSQSSRWQLEAEVPEHQFKQWVGNQVDNEKEVTAVGLQRFAKQLKGGPSKAKAKPTHECRDCGQVHPIKDQVLDYRKNDIRKLAELAFRHVRPLDLPAKPSEQGALWWQPLKEFCDMGRWQPERIVVLMWSADQKMRLSSLTVSSPKSLIKNARDLLGEFRSGELEPNPELIARAEDFCAKHISRST